MEVNPKVGPDGLLKGAGLLSRPAEEFGNDAGLEMMWAKMAFEHAEVYFNILCSVDPAFLRLTPNDDEIYRVFREHFPALSVKVIDEDEMKSDSGKEKWREYCEKFKTKVEDYSMGTLLRKNSEEEYTEENSFLVTKIQFLAVELARNREGWNSVIRKKFRRNKGEDI